jgi:hypothetical protein
MAVEASLIRLGSVDEEFYIPAVDLARLLKVTDNEIYRLIRSAVLVRIRDPNNRRAFLYPCMQNVTRFTEFHRNQKELIHQEFLREKAGREHALRLKIEMENKQKAGSLVDKEKLFSRMEPVIIAYREAVPYAELDQRLFQRKWKRSDGREMMISRCFQDSGGHATHAVYLHCRQRARIMMPYRGSGGLVGPYKRGVDGNTHTRLIQGNSSYFKNTFATKLAIEVPGPGYIHFGSAMQGFDEEFFLQVLSERKEKRKRLGLTVTRWVQIRDRNEALDLLTTVLCIAETYRGVLDSMEPLVVASEKDQTAQPAKFGARRMVGAPDDLAINETGFGIAGQPRRSGFGVLPGSGVSF